MHRKASRPEIIVGLFGIAAFLIIVYMSRQVSDAPFVRAKGVNYTVYFDSVSGLIPKTPIEIAGIQVGYVESIDLDKSRARLMLRVDPEVPIYEDAVVLIRSRGILGDKFVAIKPGTVGKRRLSEGETILGTGSDGEMGLLLETMQQAAENIRELSGTLNEFVQKQSDKGNFDAIVENMAQMSKNLNEFVAGHTDNLERILTNMEEITESVKKIVGEDTHSKVSKSVEDLEKTMASLQRITDGVERGEGTVGKLLKDDTTAKKIDEALDGISQFTKGVSRIKTDVRYRGEYLFETEDFQNLVALTIRPRPDKYFRFELVDAPVAEGQTVTETVVTDPSGTVLSSTRTIETKDDVLFSFEMAKRFYDATIRFGIIRNEGGFGFDYHLFDDILELSVEAFDFSRFDNRAHVRGYATLNLWKHLLFTAGVDDILTNDGDTDPFIGLGIAFRDDDIKTLLGAISFSSF